MEDYSEKVMLLSSARELALDSIKRAQDQYKHYFDQLTKQTNSKVGEWIFFRFPAEETGGNRKLSHPWHRPYHITTWRDPDVSTVKGYFPNKGQIQVHQQRICQCPPELIPGYYWCRKGQRSTGRIPKWVEDLQARLNSELEEHTITTINCTLEDVEPNIEEDEDINDDDSIVENSGLPESVVHNRDEDEVPVEGSAIPRQVPQWCPYSLRSSTSKLMVSHYIIPFLEVNSSRTTV